LANKIKFGTDGWRAIIAEDFTVENVARVSEATAVWVKQNFENPSVVVGHDCRFAGELFAETAIKVFLENGIKVFAAKGFVSTPMISLGAVKLNCSLGIIITASHNPPSYNGFKLKAHYGGPLSPLKVQEIEDIIKETSTTNLNVTFSEKENNFKWVDLETMYVDHVKANFDIAAIENAGFNLVYDAMYGAGQNVLKRILPNITYLHCDYNPSFMGQAPEPIAKNLGELENLLKTAGNYDVALVTDGDADRIGLYNGAGLFVDSHHIILLLIHYLVHYKGQKGKVVTAFSATPKVEKMCKHYGLEHETVKIGFKYIADMMVDQDILLGGEESGGIAVKGHIPERDGIWMGLVLWEFMAKSGKKLDELIAEVYAIVGAFQFERNDLHLTEALKNSTVEKCKNNQFVNFGAYKVARVETIDGWKFFFDENRWLMIRASGTEPVLRTYAEAPTIEEVRVILAACENAIRA
jgi:phosphomannomutase